MDDSGYLGGIPIHFKDDGYLLVMENDFLAKSECREGPHILRGWIGSDQKVVSCDLTIGLKNKILNYPSQLLEARQDVKDYWKDGPCYNFEIIYTNPLSLFRETERQNMRFILTLANGKKVGSNPVFPPDKDCALPEISQPERFTHENWLDELVKLCDKPGLRVLEIGSRFDNPVTPKTMFHYAEHIGFDYYPGMYVDVVGDAHKLNRYFESESFDLIFSSSVLEHLAMPWVAARHMINLTKTGGFIFAETHFNFPVHSWPWHFFNLSSEGLKTLFPECMGIRCLDYGMCNPLYGRFSEGSAPYLRNRFLPGLYCHSEFLGQKIFHAPEKSWEDFDTEEVTSGSVYPPAYGTL